ncbi:LamG domain-containing protein [Flammeovirga aprica]|uniref:family 16 glycosylhydrolase n=1 Tax=Flammeovirga aprica TaxID=29528 RepID=UPI00197F4667|nr:family 16 glycosylhydrolase [Flammeovirga aprica]
MKNYKTNVLHLFALLVLFFFGACSESDIIQEALDPDPEMEEKEEPKEEEVEPEEEVDKTSQPFFLEGQDPKPMAMKWVKVEALSDEFEEGSIDLEKWNESPEFLWENANGSFSDRGWYGSTRCLFSAENVSIEEGELRIEAKMYDEPQYSPKDDKSKPAKRWYGGAYVSSKTMGKPGYYFEAEMQSSSTTMSSAFWLKTPPVPCTTTTDGENLELDIQECVGRFLGSKTDEWTNDDWAVNSKWDQIFHFNTHRHATNCAYNGSRQSKGGHINFEKYNREEYHIYAAWWHEGGTQVDFFIDGRLVKSVTPPVPFTSDQRLIMSSNFYDWVKEDGRGEMGFNDSKLDRSTKFKWVRTWKLEAE